MKQSVHVGEMDSTCGNSRSDLVVGNLQ
jgi:hypothetical protein